MSLGLTLDTGALLSLDRTGRTVIPLLDETRRHGGSICIPANVVAQAWRSPRQVRLARLIRSPDVEIAVLTAEAARAVGALCGRAGLGDIVDVHVALCARERRHVIVTSDPDDFARIDPALPVIRV